MGWIKDFMIKIAARRVEKKLDLQEGPMDNKRWWKSKTIWSDVATSLLGLYAIAQPIAEKYGHPLPSIPGEVLTFLGALGIYGRKTATQTIG